MSRPDLMETVRAMGARTVDGGCLRLLESLRDRSGTRPRFYDIEEREWKVWQKMEEIGEERELWRIAERLR